MYLRTWIIQFTGSNPPPDSGVHSMRNIFATITKINAQRAELNQSNVELVVCANSTVTWFAAIQSVDEHDFMMDSMGRTLVCVATDPVEAVAMLENFCKAML